MDGKGLRALVCALVVVWCTVAVGWSMSGAVVATDTATGQSLASTQVPVHEQGQATGQFVTSSQSLLQSQQLQPQVQDDAPDASSHLNNSTETHISIFLEEDGSATVEVDYRFEAGSDDWNELESDVEANPDAYTAREEADWEQDVEEAQNRTNREMNISNTTVTTTTSSATPQDLGHVTFTFEWSSFANVVLNQIEAGDALAGWFTPTEGTTLQIIPPDGYVIEEADPQPAGSSEESVLWNGAETEFIEDQPMIVMTEDSETATTSDGAGEGLSLSRLVIVATLVVLAAVGVGIGAAAWWTRRGPGNGSGSRFGSGSSTDPRSRPPTSGAAGESVEESSTPASGSPRGNGGGSGSNSPPPELLSNEERVLKLLERSGGRIKQQQVVSELEWTEAKTSQVVGGLREDDEIDVFRIGRENVLALPDEAESEQ
ncbi:helix-turn-helix transcriptional regulator [Natrialba asiatica]|uniref:Transmembrane glycoprotein / HTH domain protein n=1 Tax=Natrialba asiatica (strain ATCC 700177 / DSM 12278 / JCM 9576 / FERM P-10747 / NBRC 102637 / 172P1) TaxID=29540 RepID=M0AID0_NATA1|nr:hypothetical protein [Natrialba asiatica]ELY98106.1 hypothetical protein C481_19260 [Natrialba asiatica DSM 12278]